MALIASSLALLRTKCVQDQMRSEGVIILGLLTLIGGVLKALVRESPPAFFPSQNGGTV